MLSGLIVAASRLEESDVILSCLIIAAERFASIPPSNLRVPDEQVCWRESDGGSYEEVW